MAEPLGGIVWRVALRVSPREDQSLRGTMQSRLCGLLALRMSRRVLGRRESVVDIFIDVGLRRTLGRGSPGRLLVPTDASNQMGGHRLTIAIVWAHSFPICAVAKTVPICSSVLLCSRACGSRGSVL